MVRFCTKCGSPAEEGMKFCMKCGTPFGEPVAPPAVAATPPPAPVAAPPAPAAAPAPAAVAQPAPKKSSAVPIILGILAFMVFVMVLGIGSCLYIGYRARQKLNAMAAGEKQGSISLPGIKVETGGQGSQAATAATQDVPVYPGAAATQSGGSLNFGGAGGISSQEYTTADSVDQVVAFYKEKMGSDIVVTESGGNATIQHSTPTGLTTITIVHDASANNTKITIARIGK